jgi:peptide/nickel transport system substrate-binding protein
MSRSGLAAVLVVGALALSACAPGPSSSTDAGRTAAQPQGPKAITIALEGEPDSLGVRLGLSSNTIGNALGPAVHQRLSSYDDRGDVFPQMAAELPSQASGTWVVRPDGTMQTTYRLRPGITWHDGTPLTARDVVFAWTVFTDSELPVRGALANRIARIDAPDDATLVMEWRRTYPFANVLVEDDLGPLPMHALGDVYQSDKDRFMQLPYWAKEFFGVGPYQLTAWEPGSFLVLRAYDRFYAGRANIDQITVQFIQSGPTAVANLLAGTVDGAWSAVEFEQAMVVKDEWERAGKKPVLVAQPTHWRWINTQFRVPNPPDILDPRVRQGLYQAVDRQAMVDTLFAGQAPVSDTFITSQNPKWDWIKDAFVKYEYNPQRAQQTLSQTSWRASGSGTLVNSSGEPVTVSLVTTPGGAGERELAMIGDSWKALGITVNQTILSRADADDHIVRASFASFELSSNPAHFGTLTTILYGRECPSEATRWVGRNRGCYLSPEMDRIVDGLQVAIDPSQQRTLYRDLAKLLSEELPILPLYFPVRTSIFREGITGIKGRAMPSGGETWNVAQWDVL